MWVQSGTAIFSATVKTPWHSKFRLQVEEMPDGKWDWIVWTYSDQRATRYGVTQDQLGAKAAAENAVCKLLKSGPGLTAEQVATAPIGSPIAPRTHSPESRE